MSWSDQLKHINEGAKNKAVAAVYRPFAKAATTVVLRSPIDTGLFVNNWNASTQFDPSTNAVPDPNANLAFMKIDVIGEKVEDSTELWFTDSLPYALDLEYGGSNQAPNGMIGITVAEMGQIVDGELKEISNVLTEDFAEMSRFNVQLAKSSL